MALSGGGKVGPLDLQDELAEIVADLRAWVEVERVSGARLLPVDAVVPAHDGQEREVPLPVSPATETRRERVPPQRLSEKMGRHPNKRPHRANPSKRVLESGVTC